MKILNQKQFMKFLTILLLMGLTTQSLANEVIFFNTSTSRSLAGTFEYYKVTKADDDVIINVLEEESKQYFTLTKEYEKKLIFYEEDKQILKTRGDKFENEYINSSKALIQCKDDAPSRLVWYSSGLVSALILGVAVLYLTK